MPRALASPDPKEERVFVCAWCGGSPAAREAHAAKLENYGMCPRCLLDSLRSLGGRGARRAGGSPRLAFPPPARPAPIGIVRQRLVSG